MGSIVAEIADKIASAGGGERSELEIRGGTGADRWWYSYTIYF